MIFGSLFSGIGGLDLGLEWAGMTCRWQVENEPYCIEVLEKHWPETRRYGDIKTIDWSRVEPVDLICGGFPCQPWSVAGKRRGKDDDRNLWPETLRAIRSMRPRYLILENVPGLAANPYFDKILDDLENATYEACPIEIPAAAFNAPHLRYRVFIVAYLEGEQTRAPGQPRVNEGVEVVANATEQRLQNWEQAGVKLCEDKQFPRMPHSEPQRCSCSRWTPEPDVGRVVYGVPHRVDRIRALGNAVVPQVAEWVGRRIMEFEEGRENQPPAHCD